MFGWTENKASAHARKLGCQREKPLGGLCVDCAFAAKCPVERVPLVLWTARITHDLRRAQAIFYLQDLSSAPLGTKPRLLPNSGKTTYRESAIEMRCGDMVRKDGVEESSINPLRTVNVAAYLRAARGDPRIEACGNYIVMDAFQARYHQVSNYGRKCILAVQTCSKKCAEELTDLISHNWTGVTTLIREHRPLRRLKSE